MLRIVTVCLLVCLIDLINADRILYSDRMFGQLISPNYPEMYPDNFDREWVITVPPGLKIELLFQYFDLQFSNKCKNDYVKISTNGKKLAKVCGGDRTRTKNAPSDVIYTSFGNQLTVQFHSDVSNELNFNGFLAHYRAIDINECEERNGGCDHYCYNYFGGFYCSCRRKFELQSDQLSCTEECPGNIQHSSGGVVSSLLYPHPYPTQVQCHWTINVDSGYVINLHFLDFDIGDRKGVVCPNNFLTIESGGYTDGPLCGSEKPRNITTKGNVVKISLFSDGLRSSRGFKAVYTKDKICVDIAAPGYGLMVGDDFTLHSTVIFYCTAGYILKGSNTRTCLADGSWSGEPTWCQIVECDRPANISHGSWISRSNNFTFGNSVLYECDRFYKLTLESEATRTCNADGKWIPQEPICEQICGEADVAPHPRPGERSQRRRRIVGGMAAVPSSWPWQVFITITRDRRDEFRCAGVVINDQWILTIADCLSPHGTTVIKIHLGSHSRTSTDLLEMYAEEVVLHPEFNHQNFDADIGLIKLTQPLQFSSTVRPICLPEQANTTDDNAKNIEHFDTPSGKGVVIGWGRSTTSSPTESNLHEAYVTLVSRAYCRDLYKQLSREITENMVCAGKGEKDHCNGDGGGPLMFRRNQDAAYFVYGLVSWGVECARPDAPGVYTRVENFVDWIRNTVERR